VEKMIGNPAGKLVRLVFCAALFGLFFAGRWTDMVRSVPEQAEEAYKRKDYQKALEQYQEALIRNPDSDTLAYNLGNTMYQLGRFEEAQKLFGRILENETPSLSADSYYNMGSTLYQMGRRTEDQESYKQSLEAFKHSILSNPEDRDAKYNYELVKRLIKEQQQQQQQQNQDNQDQDDQEKDQEQQQQQQQQQQDKEQQEQNQEKQQQQQQQKQEQAEKQQEQQLRPGQMSKEEAERILEALLQMEKNEQKKENEKQVPARRRGPDW
jgi:Ca-activated chloride channel homolog